jgi:hypothetical protein
MGNFFNCATIALSDRCDGRGSEGMEIHTNIVGNPEGKKTALKNQVRWGHNINLLAPDIFF